MANWNNKQTIQIPDNNYQTAFNTGLLTWGIVTINADPTKFDVTAGTGIIYDWTNPSSPAKIDVSWGNFTAQTVPDITKPFTTIEIDSTGALVKTSAYSTDNTADKRRQVIILNALFHPNGTSISSVINVVKPWHEVSEAAIDYIYQLGPLNTGNGASANGANLQIDKASGTTTLPWINYFNDKTKPSTQTNSAVSSINFNYNYRNWSGGFVIGSLTNTITPNLYDDGTGVLATVPNNKFTIQRIYYFSQSNLYGITYGQAIYSSITEAQAAITSENPIINPLAGSGVFVTALIVKKGTTALNNTADAYFSAISSITSSSTGATQNMQSVYNNSTPNPEIITNATNWAITQRNGAGADTLKVTEVQNSAGTGTFAVTGLGWTGVWTASPTGSLDVQATVYNPGTVSVTGTSITGSGTAFLKTFKLGDTITTTTTSGSETKEINSITSDTVMSTVSAFSGTSTNTTYTNSNTGTQFLINPNGQIKLAGTTAVTSGTVSDWILKADNVNVTGTQQFTAFRDQTVYNQTTGTTAAINTFASGSRINATGTGSFTNVRGFNSFPTVISTNTGNITTIASVLSAPQIQSGATGTITNWKWFSFNGTNSSTTNTITNMIGIDIIPTQNGGTLTNYAGVLVGAKPTAATNSTLLLLGTTTIPSGNFGIYNTSTADNYLAGSLGIGTTSLTAINLLNRKNITWGTTSWGQLNDGQIQSDVTTSARMYASTLSMASGGNLSAAQHYRAEQGALNGSILTDQRGFFAASSLTGATNNYAFYGDIPSGSNRWNLYMNGTADNFVAGRFAIGNNGLVQINLRVESNITGSTTSYGVYNSGTIQSDVTGTAMMYQSVPATQATTFTLNNLRHYSAQQGTVGLNSVITNQFGFYVDSTLTGASANYGFYSNIAAASARWNFFANGTANNAFNGNSSFGKVTAPTSAVDTTSFGTGIVTNTAGTYTVLTTDHTIIQTTAASTYTLPAASSFTGRILHLVTQFAGTVVSASSNVVPIAGGAAGTAILPATAGKFATLQSNGTNWVIIASN